MRCTSSAKPTIHFDFDMIDGTNKIDKEHIAHQNSLAKTEYIVNSMNMQSHHFGLFREKVTHAVSHPAAVNVMVKLKLSFSFLGASSIAESIAGFICKDLHPYSMVESWNPGMKYPAANISQKKMISYLYDEI